MVPEAPSMARVILKGEAKPPPPKPIQHSDHPARRDHVGKDVFRGGPLKEDELAAPEAGSLFGGIRKDPEKMQKWHGAAGGQLRALMNPDAAARLPPSRERRQTNPNAHQHIHGRAAARLLQSHGPTRANPPIGATIANSEFNELRRYPGAKPPVYHGDAPMF